MSTLYVNTIKPQSGTTVAVTGTLEVSGTIKSYALETITTSETTYLGSNKFGNDTTDTHQFTGSIFVDGNSTLGNAAADVATVTAQLTASQGAYFAKNVGIGTTSPTSNAGIARFVELSDASSAGLVLNDTGGRAQNIWSADNKLYFWNSTDGNVLTLSTDKYVGINVTDPDSHLEIFGTSTQLKLSNNTADYATLAVGTNGDLTITTVDAAAANANLTMTVDGDIILGPGGGDVLPDADNTRNLGSSAKRWANVYTGDLHLKNDRGDWTILEESDYLCVVNNATGKKYKMMLQEIDD